MSVLGLATGGVKVRSDYYFKHELVHILAVLMPENRLACEVSLATGLRIGDVLRLRTIQLKNRFSVIEEKTGKRKSIYLNDSLLNRLLSIAGKIYVFEGRTDCRKHRTRQAVYKDIRRVRDLMRLKVNLSPHTMRKTYAVEMYHKYKTSKKVMELLNHSSEAVTMLYLLSEAQTEKLLNAGKRAKK